LRVALSSAAQAAKFLVTYTGHLVSRHSPKAQGGGNDQRAANSVVARTSAADRV